MHATTSTTGRRARFATAALLAFACVPATAQATFPGERGPIAFQGFGNPKAERSQVFQVQTRGSSADRLTHLLDLSWFPDYSPNGNRILFTRTRFAGRHASDVIYTIKADGTRQTRLSTGCHGDCLGDTRAAWAPNGRRIVFERAFGPVVDDTAAKVELHIARRNGSHERAIHLDIGGREPHDAQWSPDGRRLAVNVLNVGDTKPKFGSAIYVFRADGTRLHQITPIRLNAGSPDWAPWWSDRLQLPLRGTKALADLHRATERLRPETYAPPAGGPQRVRAGVLPGRRANRLHAVRGAGHAHIWTMRRSGTHLRRVTRGNVVDVQPDWGSQTN